MVLRINLALFITSVSTLFFILRYRIHVHITYQPRSSRRRTTQRREPAGGSHPAISGEDARQGPSAVKDLESALVNLGCDKPKARRIAAKAAMREGGFDEQLRYAVREAA